MNTIYKIGDLFVMLDPTIGDLSWLWDQGAWKLTSMIDHSMVRKCGKVYLTNVSF